MWNGYYGHEPLDMKLLAIRLMKKWWILLISSLLGVLLIGGPYFLIHVTFGPAKQYEAVMDFYVDYAEQDSGEEYTYFNQTTWAQLMQDDVFTDKIMAALSPDVELDKDTLKGYLSATMLSDTRIVTTTVTTTDPDLTMQINTALITAFQEFAEEQKEISDVRILQEPTEASLVIADVRTLRACILGMVLFDAAVLLYMWLYVVLDDSIYIPATFEKRYSIPMLGTIHTKELKLLAGQYFKDSMAIVQADQGLNITEIKQAIQQQDIKVDVAVDVSKQMSQTVQEQLAIANNVLLVVKAGAHNGKQIEKVMETCAKGGSPVQAALLWDADEKLIRAYYLPEHVLAWRARKKHDKEDK